MAAPFGERLAAAVAERESNLVLGVDPDPARLWPAALRARPRRAARRARRRGGGRALPLLIAAAGAACVAVKLQLACFERLGAAGLGRARAGRAGRTAGGPAGDRRRQAR